MTNQQAKKCPESVTEAERGKNLNTLQDFQQHEANPPKGNIIEVNNSPLGQSKTPAFELMQPYVDFGDELILLKGKKPVATNWTHIAIDSTSVLHQAKQKGLNVGVRLSASDLIIDVDPRNYPTGRDSLAELVKDLRLDLSKTPCVQTGGGGFHYYLTKPEGLAIVGSLEKYPGIDFKTLGGQVVAAGSIHPDTGRLYQPAPTFGFRRPKAPEALLGIVERKTNPAEGVDAEHWGSVTPERLAEALEKLPHDDYSKGCYEAWANLMMACHHATAGEGRQEFVDWCLNDPEYTEDQYNVERHWDSLHDKARSGKPITYKFLEKELLRHGLPPIPYSSPEDDFDVWERPRCEGWDVDDDKLRAEPVACLEALLPPLKLNKKDQPETSYPNCLKLIRHINKDLGLVHDEFGGEVHLASPMLPWTEKVGHKLTDNVLRLIRRYMVELTKVDWSVDNIFEAVNTVAIENMTHPVRDYLDGLTWDGVARLDTLLVDYVGADDNPYIRAIGAKTLIAAVKRVRQPGCKFDNVIILEGFQGVGKSSFVQALCPNPDWFSDAPIGNAESKDAALGLEGHWIIELGEMSVLSKSGVEALKVFVSTGTDKLRRPYGRVVEHIPRQCIFIGSTNQDTYLKDMTGNRRFWPVRTGVVDLEGLKANIGQVWAEASLRESKGESIVLPQELWADAAKEQEERVAEDPWADIIRDYVDAEPSTGVTPAEPIDRVHSTVLLTQVLGIPPAKQSRADTQKLKIVMTKDLGWKYKDNVRIGTKVAKGYARG